MMGITRRVAVAASAAAGVAGVAGVAVLTTSPSDSAVAQLPSAQAGSQVPPPAHSDHVAASHAPPARSSQPNRPRSRTLLDCTASDQPTNFAAYSLGRGFEGRPLSEQRRVCVVPAPLTARQAEIEARLPLAARLPRDARSNFVSYTYGTCDPPPDGGCPLPLEIQTWPRCERDPTDYDIGHHNPLQAKLTVRGVPAHLYEDGLRLEVYAGESTIVVFGLQREQVLRAGRALIKAPARPRDPVEDRPVGGSLPPSSGPISCE